MKFEIFLDMDGVIVNFEKGVLELINNFLLEHKDILQEVTKKNKTAQKIIDSLGRDYIEYTDIKNNKLVRNLMFSLISSPATKGFWENLEWVEGGKELWSFIKDYNPTILSSPVESDEDCVPEKIRWCIKNLGISESRIIIKTNKHEHAFSLKTGPAILIDDTEEKINKWVNAGGIGILYKTGNPKEAIKKIKALHTVVDTASKAFDGNL